MSAQFLLAGWPARAGVHVWRDESGRQRRTLVEAAELFSAETLASFDGAPLTRGHAVPAGDIEGARACAIGTLVGPGRRDGERVRASVRIEGGAEIVGSEPLSIGFLADFVPQSGEAGGERFDDVARRIRITHVALLQGAGGAGVRLAGVARVSRVDLYDLANEAPAPTTTPEGFLRLSGRIARVGVQNYEQADGTVRRELRPRSEVFAPASVASFKLVPLTLGHPAELLTPATVRDHAVGSIGTPRPDGAFLAADDILVTDSAAITAIKAGQTQLSAGYDCVLLPPDPALVPEFGEHDAVQAQIRANHVAIVVAARCGPACSLRVDCAGCNSMSIDAAAASPSSSQRKGNQMTKGHVKIGDELMEATPENAAKIQEAHDALVTAHGKELAQRDAEIERLKASDDEDDLPYDEDDGTSAALPYGAKPGPTPRDEAEEIGGAKPAMRGIAPVEAAHKPGPTPDRARAGKQDQADLRRRRVDSFHRQVAQRVELVRLGERFNVRTDDSQSNRAIRSAIATKVFPDLMISANRSDDYLIALVEAAVAGAPSAADLVRGATASAQVTGGARHLDSQGAREAMITRLRDVWRRPAPKVDAAQPQRQATSPQAARQAMMERNRQAAVRK